MSSPIKEVLQTLSRHADVVEEALTGIISSEGGTPGNAIGALRQASALRPAGDEGYRLHPRLREYLHDHLQLYPAYQELAEIGSRISQVRALWNEIEFLRAAGDHETVSNLLESLYTSVYDIADNMDRNMLMLQTLMSTRFGNVRSLEAKKGQNSFYQGQAATLSGDLGRLSLVCETIEREASTRGMEELARFLRRSLLARIMPWQQGLSELQTEIRKELFRTREVEHNLKLLARLDMLLHQQPAWRGFDADLSADIPAFLLATSLPAFAPHVEPLESDRAMVQEMEGLARSLPPKRVPAPDTEPPKRYSLVVDPPRVPEVPPAAKALERLARDVRAAPDGLSLIAWRDADEDAQTMSKDVWLVFAVMGLRSRKLTVELLHNAPLDGERFAHTFRDAWAHTTGVKAAESLVTA